MPRGAGDFLVRLGIHTARHQLSSTLPPRPLQVLECAHKFKSQEKAAVLSSTKGDEQYKVRDGAQGTV